MGLRLPGRFLWDFWTLDHAGRTWLFALSATRHADPETRHGRARVDLAVSRDLVRWRWLGPVLEPGPPGAWDDLSIWTGSVAARPEGGFAMLYTGRSRAEGGAVQRIGLALSDDLSRWRKHPDPVLTADPARYRTADAAGHCHWRDPWLVAEAGRWRAYVTAQHAHGSEETAGTIAVAESCDLIRWRVGPPVVAEPLASALEVPQVVAGGAAMLANVYPDHVAPGSPLPRACASILFRRQGGDRGGFVLDRVIEAWPSDSRYVLKEVRPGVGLCWLGRQADGTFLGEIGDPFPLDLTPVGTPV